jgi:hypothetical protein
MSLADPSFSIASELGELSITNLELRNLQDELDQSKQDILEIIKGKFSNSRSFNSAGEINYRRFDRGKACYLGFSIKRNKKLKEHFIQVEDERQLETSCFANL